MSLSAEAHAEWLSEAFPQPEPVPVRHWDWVQALTAAAAEGKVKPDVLGYAMVFTRGGFDYSTGRQTQPKTVDYLGRSGCGSRSTWVRRLDDLREGKWLGVVAHVRSDGPRPTPMHQLTVPNGSYLHR